MSTSLKKEELKDDEDSDGEDEDEADGTTTGVPTTGVTSDTTEGLSINNLTNSDEGAGKQEVVEVSGEGEADSIETDISLRRTKTTGVPVDTTTSHMEAGVQDVKAALNDAMMALKGARDIATSIKTEEK